MKSMLVLDIQNCSRKKIANLFKGTDTLMNFLSKKIILYSGFNFTDNIDKSDQLLSLLIYK